MYDFDHKTLTDATIGEIITLASFIEKNPIVLTKLREKKYTAHDTDKTFRIINYWESVGLLDNNRQSSGVGWRKFSMMDLVFMHLLAKLREFDFSIQKLKVVKADLEGVLVVGKAQNRMTILEYAYLRAFAGEKGGNTYFMITPDGHTTFVTQKDIFLMQLLGEVPEGYIFINFNQLLSKRVKLSKNSIPVHDDNAYVLTEKERAILEILRTKEYKSISITPKDNGESLLIECTTDYVEGAELPDYADILTRVQDGSIVQRQVKEKIKVK